MVFIPATLREEMALFSFRHSVKTFSEKRRDDARAAELGQTAAHLRYITRPQAARVVLQERLPGRSQVEAARISEKEAQKRRGRVCERFVIALPVEASPSQREALVQSLAEQFSKGVAGYVAAIHDQHGNDIKNPHAHFVFFDVQQKTGGRGRPKSTLGMARKNAIENAASLWAKLHNRMMREWGFESSSEISHLSYSDRGINRIPTIHEGASARATVGAKKTLKNEWRRIDQGHTRAEANAVIREINALKEERHDARTLRLGEGDGHNTPERSSSFAEQRACGGGNGQALARVRPLFNQARQPDENNRRTAGCPAPAKPRHEGFSPLPASPPLSRPGLSRHHRRRGSIRRIYHELIMLRDTLRARLLQAGVARPTLPVDSVNKRPRILHRQLVKPRRGGAAQEPR